MSIDCSSRNSISLYNSFHPGGACLPHGAYVPPAASQRPLGLTRYLTQLFIQFHSYVNTRWTATRATATWRQWTLKDKNNPSHAAPLVMFFSVILFSHLCHCQIVTFPLVFASYSQFGSVRFVLFCWTRGKINHVGEKPSNRRQQQKSNTIGLFHSIPFP